MHSTVGNHATTVKRSAWFIPILILQVTLIFMLSVVVFSQVHFNNSRHAPLVTSPAIIGTQVGAPCTKENEAINKPGISGGNLFCLKTPQGLLWHDFDTIIATAYLNTVLPSCETPRYTKATLTPEMIQLAEDYFKERNLLPVKVTMVGQAVRYLFTEGIRVCSNGIGLPPGAYAGFIPREASAGWSIMVLHKSNGFGDTNFLKIVRIGDAYKVMEVDTSP
ncbi:hypothetical protein GALL_352670 [mine drainage metagenome]|uniref:Uncharacterized protein n=1 Tax=mine drainage metagenome TaxID=410659 RepID=A0A1J5QHL7_9ZZZZ